jgi:DNA replication and repair protein RecF
MAHELFVGFQPGEPKRIRVDGAARERLLGLARAGRWSPSSCPTASSSIKGPPTLRRSHLDALVTGLWPTRAGTRRAYAQVLAQRNALLGAIRAGASRSALAAWDLELARHGIALRDDRARAVERIAGRFRRWPRPRAASAGHAALPPRSRAATAEELAAELAERLDSDLERRFTQHGPHRDDLAFLRDDRELRVFGSQGEQRLGLLALLLAEREALAEERGVAPLLLLDDVMSELDADRRRLLVERVTAGRAVPHHHHGPRARPRGRTARRSRASA